MKINILTFSLMVWLFLLSSCFKKQESMQTVIDRSMKSAIAQSKAMAAALNGIKGQLPRTTDKETGKLITSDYQWWCSGFFPGTLWYLYEYSNDEELKSRAVEYSSRVEPAKYLTNIHDVGFMVNCSFGNGLRLTRDTSYASVLLTGTKSLVIRFNPKTGLVRSWDFNRNKWQFPVIIDNMMNLEILMRAFQISGDSTFYRIAVSHADKTMINHYRKDNSCFHLVSYDTITGLPQIKQTVQGASDSSIWARGQAWGLYGYTMMYKRPAWNGT